jgi:peptide/nickel transport system substrate-binding protein
MVNQMNRSLGPATAALTLLLVAACAGDPAGAQRNGDDAGDVEPAAEQSLVVGATDDQYVLEGERAGLGMYPLNANIFETLTYLTPDYEVKPLLAESWELIEPNTWRFHLRKGVSFHDAQPLDAQAVKDGLFDRTAQIEGGATIKAGPDSTVVVDEYTVDFTPTVPNLRVPEQLVHPNYSVVAPGSTIGEQPVGTGPFQFVEYRPNEQISVERNPEYWREPSRLERIEFRFYPDANARSLALQSGDVHVIYDVPRPDVETLRTQDLTVQTSTVGSYEAMYANKHGKPPYDELNDVRVRRAVGMSVDREALVDGVLDGLATADQTWVPPASLGDHAELIDGLPFNQAAAGRLLDEAGWTLGPDGVRTKDGEPLALTLVSGFPSAETHRPIPSFLQSQLAEVGIEVEIVERPDSASFQALISTGEGELFLEQGSQNDANAGFLPVLLLYTGGSGATAPYQSLFAPGKRFDALIEPSLSSADPDEVQKAVAEAMHEAIDEQAVLIPLAGIYRIYGMQPEVQDFTPHPSYLSTRWNEVWLSGS